MTNANTRFTSAECTLIRRVRRLRERAMSFDVELGVEVTRLSARGWKRDGFAGMADAFEFMAGWLEVELPRADLLDFPSLRALYEAADWMALDLASTQRTI